MPVTRPLRASVPGDLGPGSTKQVRRRTVTGAGVVSAERKEVPVTCQQRAVVIGAGPAGLATAIALRKAGVDTVVYERATDLRKEGTGLTLWPNGLAALDAFGAGAAARGAALAAPGMSIRSYTGRVLYEVSGSLLDSIGGRGVAVHRAELLQALADMLDPDMIRFAAQCVSVRTEPNRAVATFADGREVSADLVIGADGIRSVVRSASQLGGRLRYGGCTVWRATIPFRLPPCPGLLFLGSSGQFGLWRLPDERVYWFASTPAAESANKRGASRPPDWFSTWHEPIPDLLAATPTEQIMVTDIYDSRPLRAWSTGRVVLVGDAAHPSMPNMGQGTSQAFEDAAVLAGCLGAGLGVAAALRTYESRRRRRARAAWSQARLMAHLGGWSSPAACWMREWMMSAAPQRVQIRQLERLFTFPGSELMGSIGARRRRLLSGSAGVGLGRSVRPGNDDFPDHLGPACDTDGLTSGQPPSRLKP